MSPLYDITALQAALERGEIVLTPNQRLRNRIREAFAATRGAISLTPRVYSLTEWLDQCWQQLQQLEASGKGPVLANDLQMQLVWQQAIEADNHDQALYVSKRLVQQAIEASRNLILWQLPLERITAFGDPTDYPLLNWTKRVEQRLASLGMITREACYRLLLQAFTKGLLPRVPVLHLERLGDLPPLIAQVLEAAAEQVTVVVARETREPSALRLAASSFEEEIRTAAHWAHRRLQEDRDASIGIIVPELGTRRDLVERLFCEHFEAQFYSPQQPRYTLPFNISTGTPLGQAPVISAALQLLQFGQLEIEVGQLSNLINSPFWGVFDEELGIRAALLETLRYRGQLRHSPAELRSIAQKLADGDGRETSLEFSRRLQTVGSEWRRLGSAALPGQWVERILAILDLYVWPGSRPLDSVEYQQVRQFHQLLERFASLDLLQQTVSRSEGISMLGQLASATPFQAEVRHSPIQILGTLEGDGLRFDYCWVMGMTGQAWPPRPEPNPLLPLQLQRQLGMPRSSVDREITFASALTNHYRQCASTVIFSHATQVDEAQMVPSPLIADLPPIMVADVLDGRDSAHFGLPQLYAQLQNRRQLQSLDCSYGPAFEAEAGVAVRGGTGVLQQQARCPFDAFATFRLGARQPVEPILGLSPADKGSAIHGVMAKLWEVLMDQAGLEAHADRLSDLIDEAVETVFRDLSGGARLELGERYLALEKARVRQLAEQILALELQREPFRVAGIEEELLREFAGLTFRLRMDRIDQTAAGHYLIIDYKTGNAVHINQWLGERPEEPQLPLYALCYPEPVSGISFACVRTQDPGYCGIVAGEIPAWDKRIKTPEQLKDADCEDWPALLASFENHLAALATEYREGYAAVAPKNVATATRYNAHLLPLNRLGEADFITYYLDQQ
jgi:ATP-dependent helicase/nuclease subunit B